MRESLRGRQHNTMNDDTKLSKTYDDYGRSKESKYDEQGRYSSGGREGFNYKLDSLCRQIHTGKNQKSLICTVCHRMKDKHEFSHHIEIDPLLVYKLRCNLCRLKGGKYEEKAKAK